MYVCVRACGGVFNEVYIYIYIIIYIYIYYVLIKITNANFYGTKICIIFLGA